MNSRTRNGCKGASLALLLMISCSFTAHAQAPDPALRDVDYALFATFAASHSNLPGFVDNALGFTFGGYIQPSTLGVEMRGNTYPLSARFNQSPITVGLRTRKSGTLSPYLYCGWGMSHATDIGRTVKTIVPAQWSPLWQVSVGADRRFRSVSWRVTELSIDDAYTNQHSIRTVSISTGIVIHSARW
jgi:hypothetical protein